MIVSYLRAHPEVNYVALSYDGVGVGLPAALKAAGLADKVKIIGEAPTATNVSYVEAGTQGAQDGRVVQPRRDHRRRNALHADGIQAKAQREYMNTDGHWWSETGWTPTSRVRCAPVTTACS